MRKQIMRAIWKNFYMQKGTEVSALRLVTRHKVSLAFEMPSYYREKIREWEQAGFTHLALQHVGPEQAEFVEFVGSALLSD